MDRALREAQATVALLSAPYLKSEWCRGEARAAIGIEGHRLLPLVIEEGCRPDGLLAGRVYCDVAALFEQGAEKVAELIEEIFTSGKPIEEAPPARPYLRHAAFISNVVLDDKAVFVGREAELKALEEALQRGGAAAITQAAAVHGLGGVGKTALARAYAAAHRHRYRGVWLIRAQEPTTIVEDLADLAAQLSPDLEDVADRAAAARAGLHQIAHTAGRPMLLVFDNVEEPEHVREWRPAAGAHILVTSRWRDWSASGMRAIALEVLTPESATDLLLTLSGRTDRGAARNLAEQLGRLPLALTHAGAVLRQAKTLSFDDCAADLSRRLATLPKGAGDYPATVRAAFESNLAMLSRDDADAPQMLALAAYCAPDAIPLEVWDMEPALETLPDALRAPARRAEALGALEAWSLVALDMNQRTLSVHRLAQSVLRAIAEETDRSEAFSAAVVGALNALYPETDFQHWPLCERLSAHAEAALALLPDGAAIVGASRLANQVGLYRYRRAEYAAAEPLMRRALAIAERRFGPEHPNVARDLNNLAQLLAATNRQGEAEPLMRRALAISERSLGPEHPEVATHLNNLAQLLAATNRQGEAEPLMRRALAIDERSLGPEHPKVARDLNNLAGLLHATNRRGEAEPLMRRALAISERSLGPEHPNVATDLNNLAQLLAATNRQGEAEPLMRRALAIDERSFGPEHPEVATGLNNLAGLLHATNRRGEAEPLMRRALAIFEKSLPAGHPHIETCRRGLTQMQTSATKARRVRNSAHSHAERQRAAGDHASAAHVQSNRNRTPNYMLLWIIALMIAAALASAPFIRLQ